MCVLSKTNTKILSKLIASYTALWLTWCRLTALDFLSGLLVSKAFRSVTYVLVVERK